MIHSFQFPYQLLPLPWPDISFGTLHLLLNTEIWSVSGAICKIIDIFWRLEGAGVTADLDPPFADLDPPQNFSFKHRKSMSDKNIHQKINISLTASITTGNQV